MSSVDEGAAVRIVRNIDAPIERVYDAFVNPDQLMRWMGPEGCRATSATVDLRIGGSCLIRIERDGDDVGTFLWEFVEMDPPNRLEFSVAFGGPGGVLEDHRSRMVLEFREGDPGGTELTLVHDRLGHAPPGGPGGVESGWTQATGKLARFLETGSAYGEPD